MNDQDIKNIFARLTVHEFMIEVLFSLRLASEDKDTADLMIEEMRRLSGQIYSMTSDDSKDGQAISEMRTSIETMTDNLLDKAEIRSRQIRGE